jgi:hypothetical protein
MTTTTAVGSSMATRGCGWLQLRILVGFEDDLELVPVGMVPMLEVFELSIGSISNFLDRGGQSKS